MEQFEKCDRCHGIGYTRLPRYGCKLYCNCEKGKALLAIANQQINVQPTSQNSRLSSRREVFVNIDSQGRILIPKNYLTRADIKDKIYFFVDSQKNLEDGKKEITLLLCANDNLPKLCLGERRISDKGRLFIKTFASNLIRTLDNQGGIKSSQNVKGQKEEYTPVDSRVKIFMDEFMRLKITILFEKK